MIDACVLNSCNSYAAYHHFRNNGWVVKSGLKYGTNFVLYKDSPSHYHAEYVDHTIPQSIAREPSLIFDYVYRWAVVVQEVREQCTANNSRLPADAQKVDFFPLFFFFYFFDPVLSLPKADCWWALLINRAFFMNQVEEGLSWSKLHNLCRVIEQVSKVRTNENGLTRIQRLPVIKKKNQISH